MDDDDLDYARIRGPELPQSTQQLYRTQKIAGSSEQLTDGRSTEEWIEASTVEKIFQEEIKRGPLPPKTEIMRVAGALNRKWVASFTHGPWQLRQSVRVILDDGPRMIEALERQRDLSQGEERSRLHAVQAASFRRLLEAAQGVIEAGVRLPAYGETPPASTRENLQHRDWKAVFAAVWDALLFKDQARSLPRKPGSGSPAIRITRRLLEKRDIHVTEDALLKMLQRSPKKKRARSKRAVCGS
jgi:hypothetical protein